MDAIHSKSAFLYKQIRRALQAGRYVPGQRIDPTTLAMEFRTSATPVRFALYRLIGEGLIADHARSGLYVPLPTEVALRELYDWMERLLIMACDIDALSTARKNGEIVIASADDDLVKLTWKLFDAIAAATDYRPLHQTVRQANDRLAPIRHAKHRLLDNPFEELSTLNRHWQRRDFPALRIALHNYHELRKQLVPRIVAFLNEGAERLR